MGKIVYLSEILQFAIEKERESQALYREMLEREVNPGTKKLFEYLVEQEKQHELFYAELLEHEEKQQTPKVQEDSEYVAYMRELIATSRKNAPVSELDFSDHHAVIDYAIAREKDSVIFYVNLKECVSETAHMDIDKIIKEEGKHIAALESICGGCSCSGCPRKSQY